MLEGDDKEHAAHAHAARASLNVRLGHEPCMHHADLRPMRCTNQSIRRSAAQWAGRCGSHIVHPRNTGRWKSLDMLAK